MSGLRAGEVLNQRWQLHRGALLQLLDRLPESAGAFRVWPGGMSTLQLVNHIADHAAETIGRAFGSEAADQQAALSLAEGRNRLLLQAERFGAALEAQSGKELLRLVQVKRLGITVPGSELISLHIQHEAYHCGQLTYHARMLAIEPPYYVRNLWVFAHKLSWTDFREED